MKDSVVTGVEIGIDPCSKATGVAVFRPTPAGRAGLMAIEVRHRGQLIHEKMEQRAAYRRGRRSRNLRYRQPRFNNRSRPKGWLDPSLQHRVDTTASIVARIRRFAPVTAIHQELVRFDTQQMENPEIAGTEYQRGTLFGYEIREYRLAKFNRTCAYCGATAVPLNIDHIRPRSKNGTNKVSNLALACVDCNQSKGSAHLEVWLVMRFGPAMSPAIAKRVFAQAKAPLKDAAVVNATRWALYEVLKATGLPVSTGSGGRTKWNQGQFGVLKTHTLDALCVGRVDGVVSYPSQVTVAEATGRGRYSRTIPTRSGFPRLYLPRVKLVSRFATGDLVRATVPKGKHAGTHVGRVADRSTGSFHIATHAGTTQGISRRPTAPSCSVQMAGDGHTNKKESLMQHDTTTTSQKVGTLALLLPALKDRVSGAGGIR